MKLRVKYSTGPLWIATLLLLSGTAAGLATMIPLADGRSLQGADAGGVFPDPPFCPLNSSLWGGAGSASQYSVISSSATGFSGSLAATSGGRAAADYYSIFDLTFRLQEAHFYSFGLEIASSAYGASTWYFLQLTGTFDLNAFDSGLSYSSTGVLGPGDYRFFLMNNAFHSERDYPVSSSITTQFEFSVQPLVSVPDEGSTVLLTGVALALLATGAWRLRPRDHASTGS